MKCFTTKMITASLMTLCFSATIFAQTIEVGQKDKKFTKSKIEINVGDTVKFINEDTFFHNVFSLSDIKFFDLGSFPKGEFKEVTFDKAGTIEVECAIHPEMIMTIDVK
ncbi:MAG: methylamine utilization protein [Gammaproteobacteria bacterium]|nr:MAG: methylamine utilization protein [Gammaproteobacteria bacterium]PCI71645.1 MAG: methylamine utilization protein [Gammaproteobacteria bacterium]